MRPLTSREKQALVLWVVMAAIIGIIYYWPEQGLTGQAVNLFEKEKVVAKRRKAQAAEGGMQDVLKQLEKELAGREKGMIQAETMPQAQAQLVQIVRRVAGLQQPGIQFKNVEFGPVRELGAYGEVSVVLTLEVSIEQVVNYLTDLGNQAELISVSDVQFGGVATKQKLVPVRATVTGIVPKKLVPEKKREVAF